MEETVINSISNITCALFDKINETGELHGVTPENWQKINDEFIERYGVSNQYLAYLSKMRQYVIFIEKSQTDKSYLNFAKRAKREAESIEKLMNESKNDVNKYVIASKFMGFRVNPNEYTVKEFYDILNTMKNDNN